MHLIQVMQVMLVMKVMQASLAHLWVDFQVIFIEAFPKPKHYSSENLKEYFKSSNGILRAIGER